MITEELGAKKLGLTVEQFSTLGDAANAVYNYIGGNPRFEGRKDGLWPRKQLIEILFDCNRVELELEGKGMGYYVAYPEGPEIAKKIRGIGMDKLAKAMVFHFPCALWE